MKKETKQQLKEYTKGLKTLQKVVKILAENEIYYFAASHFTETSIIIQPNEVVLDSIFKIVKRETYGDLIYTYVDIDSEIVKLTI
jgi:hypothetical protein